MASESIDSLEAPRQVTGVGKAKRIRDRGSEMTLDTKWNIRITDEKELPKRRVASWIRRYGRLRF